MLIYESMWQDTFGVWRSTVQAIKKVKEATLVNLFMVGHVATCGAFFCILSAEKLIAGKKLHAIGNSVN